MARALRASLALASFVALAACSRSARPSSDGDAAKTKTTTTVDPVSLSPTNPPPSDKRATIHLTGGGAEAIVSAEVVQSEALIERGLMYRTHMPPDDGMLFLMPEESDHVFWMHNTIIPLDLIFIGKDMKVAGVVANATPQTDDRRSVGAKSVYVLEVNGGWCAAHQIAAGAAARFEGVEAAAH